MCVYKVGLSLTKVVIQWKCNYREKMISCKGRRLSSMLMRFWHPQS